MFIQFDFCQKDTTIILDYGYERPREREIVGVGLHADTLTKGWGKHCVGFHLRLSYYRPSK